MTYKTGKSKSLDEITLEDVLEYPIWEYALDEEGLEGQDESWQRPVTDTDNVTDEIIAPIITVKIKDTEIYGSGEYDNETESIVGITIWIDGEWKSLSDSVMSVPITFISVPKIDGVENIEFICSDLEDEEAFRI